jgi:Putative Ig domain/Glycine rich protein/IPT/TIG domain
MHRSTPIFRLPLLAVAAAVGAAGLLAGGAVPAQAALASTTFSYTGAEQTYSVPPGVTQVTIAAVGAPGGGGFNVGGTFPSGGAQGLGAAVTATVTLPVGTSTLYVEVGGTGGEGTNCTFASPDCSTPGGFNGGGAAGFGGGGGGASDVRLDPASTPLTTADTRLVVAGGGGGGGGVCGGPGGTAGDPTVTGAGNGGLSNALNCFGAAGGNGGFGGSAGGAAGGGANPGCAADPGALGQGGNSNCAGNAVGGAGGAGYYGGGGSPGNSPGGGGGAGSSFWVPGAANTSMTEDTTGVPEVIITPIVPPLKVTTTSLPAATGGQPYTATLAATGGVTPYAWSVTAGSLPPGLSLNASTGVISGTPDVTGTYAFTVTVTDAESPAMTASAALAITVSGPVITSLRPDSGPQYGDTPVIITGTGLSCPAGESGCKVTVTFGTHPALVEFVRTGEIGVVSPAGTGTVTVTVTVGGVSSQATEADQFTY